MQVMLAFGKRFLTHSEIVPARTALSVSSTIVRAGIARHLGIAGPDRVTIPGDRIYQVYGTDPDRVRRYAAADVEEVAALPDPVGRELARMAIEKAKAPCQPQPEVVLPTELVLRGTTWPCLEPCAVV